MVAWGESTVEVAESPCRPRWGCGPVRTPLSATRGHSLADSLRKGAKDRGTTESSLQHPCNTPTGQVGVASAADPPSAPDSGCAMPRRLLSSSPDPQSETPMTTTRRSLRTALTLLATLALGLSTPAGAGKRKKKQEAAAAAEAAAATKAATESVEIVLPCDWTKGSAYTYTTRHHRSDPQKPYLEKMETENRVTVTVTGSGNPARFRYALSNPSVRGPETMAAPVQAALEAQLSAKPDLDLRMEDGTVVAVENFQEVADATWAFLQPSLEAKGASPAALAQTEQMIRSPATGMPIQLQEPAPLFLMHCMAMTVGEVIEYEDPKPNPLGGPPIPGFSRITLTAHDAAAQQVTFETLTRSQPGAIESILEGARQKAVSMGLSDEDVAATLEKARAAMGNVDAISTSRFVYSTADGFPDFIESQQQLTSGTVSQVNTRSWTRTATDSAGE